MIQATVFAYFVLVALAVVMVVFPDRRVRASSALWRVLDVLVTPMFRLTQTFLGWFFRSCGVASLGMGGACNWVAQHRFRAIAAMTLVVAPSLVALGARGPALFDFAELNGAGGRQVTQLLEGEQLVPPMPLPPEVFSTREVEMVRPDIGSASRDWSLLDPEFTQRLLVVFRIMKERHGYEMVLVEGYRSSQRQEQLFAQGRQVTQAAANMSYHQYGLAADAAFLLDGRIAISERDPRVMRGYELYGEVAEQLGLSWGGNWRMQDYGHVELRRPGILGTVGSGTLAGGPT